MGSCYIYFFTLFLSFLSRSEYKFFMKIIEK